MSVAVIGISGGSGSGKTTLANKIQEYLGEEQCNVLLQDHYYVDQSHLFDYDGGAVNFDHPNAIDFEVLVNDIVKLKNRLQVSHPLYDFDLHKRKPERRTLLPRPYLIVDGILIFTNPDLFKSFDKTIFIDTPESLRKERRLERDVKERGRNKTSVLNQYNNHVKPMYDQFVSPTKEIAGLVVKSDYDLKEVFHYLQI